MSFLVALQLLFIGLKLAGCIAWSWWLVMLPFTFAGIVNLLLLAIYAAVLFARRKQLRDRFPRLAP